MKLPSASFWKKASDAREELENQVKDNDHVCFVDIGYPQSGQQEKELSLRINVCQDTESNEQSHFPEQVNGIPVHVSQRDNRT